MFASDRETHRTYQQPRVVIPIADDHPAAIDITDHTKALSLFVSQQHSIHEWFRTRRAHWEES